MTQELITEKQGKSLIISFVIGSSIILGLGGKAKQDAWISGALGLLAAMPAILLYARLLTLYRGKDLFQILTLVYGRLAGRVLSMFYAFYAFHLGALVLRNIGEFIHDAIMGDTPLIVSILVLSILAVIAVLLGVEVISRIIAFILPIVMGVMLLVIFISIPQLEPDFIRPILGTQAPVLLSSAFSVFSFPFAETILFMGIFSSLHKEASPTKVYLSGNLLGGLFLLLVTIRNIMLIGPLGQRVFFPSYMAVSFIKIGDFFEHIEITVVLSYLTGIFTKVAVCLLSASKGLSAAFNLKHYKPLVIQMGLSMAWLAYFIYTDTNEMYDWAVNIYPIYAFPFQVAIPLVTWILAEIQQSGRSRFKRHGNRQ